MLLRRNRMKKKKNIKHGMIVTMLIIMVICFCHYENNHIGLTKYQYKTNKLRENKTYKIIQISDFHNKKIARNNEQLVSIVKKEKPDVIAITGDFIDSRNTNTDISLNLAQQLVGIAPVFYVTGNHEYAVDGEKLYSFQDELASVGVRIMYDENIALDGGITIIGLDELSLNDDTLNEIIKKSSEDDLRILLAHEPQYFQKYVDIGVDIALCGHAHGGQIRIPFTNIGLVAPNQGFFPKYTSGQYISGSTTMFVSRGIGNSILPLRIFNCPEIVELEIMSEK
jgi:hypothetical protein